MRPPYPSVAQILTIAQDITAKVANCWAVTADRCGGANARIVQPLSSQTDQHGWVVRFLTSGKSRKVDEIARFGRITLGYQFDADQAYVTLLGSAKIVRDPEYLKNNWQAQWDGLFAAGSADRDAVIVEVTVEGVEVWNAARGVVGGPTGLGAATLQWTQSGWQLQGC